ncbi:LmbE family N-acetylglucosaminyl deacetylase [Hamadaea flava]|uniref:PIG-L deacetylase family protein n=1 Tax=Hamadaea flava TaxID=1742688 RepID=A0ABV8LII9_9ACTN|nr:PIG-L family deacetylase [Hamadaea flava]MCP2325091.1 LmbE family N-acetylglucosaminyl deacetylase [Hamadaea flava]
MLSLATSQVRTVVAIGAHPDDIEIAAGGLLLTLAAAVPGVRVHYVLCTGSANRQAEARAAATACLPGAELSFDLHDLPDGRLPGHWAQTKQILQSAAATVTADLVLVPSPGDAHQDHRLIGELALSAFRDQLVLHYEIPKWDGDLGRPNLYVPLADEVARRKVEVLNDAFPSQKAHDWWDDEVFFGLMRLRGMESRARYAEAYSCSKATLTF